MKTLFWAILLGFSFGACSKHAQTAGVTRSYRMGFMSSAPRPDINQYLESLSLWPLHSDATIISTEVPWDSLLNGESPGAYVANNYQYLVTICRSKNLKIWVYIDPENGLNRVSDADQLVSLGKSIAQSDMQQVYRRFAIAMDSVLHPDHLGLALETNLIRAAAPDSIYQGVKNGASAAASDIRAIDAQVQLSVSIQAEVAWGKLNGSTYVGISQDLTDFPFVQELGISSYPYLSFNTPASLPLNYYSKLVEGHSIPVFVSEGGWTSSTIAGFNGQPIEGSPAEQAAYIRRQGMMLSQAGGIGLFQLTFTDLDLAGWTPQDSLGLLPFASLGVVDTNFNAKPALSTWDSLLKMPLN